MLTLCLAWPAARADLLDTLGERAQRLADSPWQAPPTLEASALKALDYDAHRQIRFRPERALWREVSDFQVQFLHAGFLFAQPLRVYEWVDGQRRPIHFHPDLFRYDDDAAQLDPEQRAAGGFSGLRLHYPLNREDVRDEFLVFQGASYFRLVGRGQRYGLSARGLAVDTTRLGSEEFPAFTELHLQRPEPEDRHVNLFALLEGPSVTGAYAFRVHTTEPVTVDVQARLFARHDLTGLGIAPLTSMYTHGDLADPITADFRPRVHDSEGLLVHTRAGEWIWRPLSRPETPQISAFLDVGPSAFGLMQRTRGFAAYLDQEARYDLRPGLWVEPAEGDWGAGRVVLLELPTPDETHDNIVAFWAPDKPMAAGESREFSYRLTPLWQRPSAHELARVVRTRAGAAGVPGQGDPVPLDQRRFVVDFQGGPLSRLDGSLPVRAHLDLHQGQPVEPPQVTPLPDGGWRATFVVAASPESPADMRLQLRLHDQLLTETWQYLWRGPEDA
ncbi:glucan biosynthesis protein [Ectothiorhodospira variabilis]|uniref:glucan biosynthesis protein n=1 Tax=Ectothiorhodospira variabilis TaxID=505694 RepID=UPI001EFA920E|nr:glucan biosynthesis protein [Ectothiorhodospira variabilis]MCG5496140.1 glucan biosynthesis protein [Ectothiorhodospira variabilis]